MFSVRLPHLSDMIVNDSRGTLEEAARRDELLKGGRAVDLESPWGYAKLAAH